MQPDYFERTISQLVEKLDMPRPEYRADAEIDRLYIRTHNPKEFYWFVCPIGTIIFQNRNMIADRLDEIIDKQPEFRIYKFYGDGVIELVEKGVV